MSCQTIITGESPSAGGSRSVDRAAPVVLQARRWARKADLRVILLLGAAAALFFWPLWVLNYRSPIGGGDLWGQLYPVWSYVSEWLRRGVLPLWSTRLMGGDPIISEGQYGLVNPLNWPLFLSLPIPPWLISLRGGVSLWLAGSGLYLYLRRSPVWRLGRTAACVSAIAYMFSDPFIAHLGHPQFNDTIAWLPWVLWGTDRAIRQRRGIPAAAMALAALLVSGHGQAALYAAAFIGAYALWQSLEGGRHRALRRLGRIALAALVAAWLAAPGLLPGLERYPYTNRAAIPPNPGEYEFHTGMGWDFISPLYHGRNMTTFWGPWDRVENGSVGIVAVGLAILGLTTVRKRRTAFLWIAALTTVLFALGTRGPIYPHLADLPLFEATWKTGRAIFLLSFVLAIAAGLGVQLLLRARIRTLWGVLAIGCAVLIGLRAAPWSALAPSTATSARALSGLRLASVALGCAGVLGLLGRRHPLGRAGLVIVALSELVATGAMADAEPMPQARSDPHAETIAYLRADQGWFRVDVDGAARGLWSPASIMAAGFDVPQGTGNPMEIVVYSQFYWGIPHKGIPAYNILGAKYVIVPKGAQPGADGIWPVFLDDPLIDVHLNTNALTRVWLVYDVVSVDSPEAAYARVLAPEFTPSTAATTLGGPALATEGQGTIEVLAYGPNRAAFQLTSSEPGLLVLSDLLYPGWHASIDGKDTKIYATDGIFRGVYVPAGTSRVDMRFFPASVQVGLGLLVCGLMVTGLVAWKQRVVSTETDRRVRHGAQEYNSEPQGHL